MAGTSYADFIQSYDPLNSYNQGSGSGSYTVQGGETLQGIAQAVYGDASLWYKIAEVNGLRAGTSLSEGQRLNLPAGVSRNTYNADSLKAYDPSEAVGDLFPDAAKPPKKKGCGIVGQILLAVIAIAVTAWAGPGAIALFQGLGPVGAAIAGGALAGAAGSVASQAVGIATKIQTKFSFKGVALAALGGAIGGGLGSLSKASGALGKLGAFFDKGKFLNDAIRGVATNILTQGVAIATKLQNKFDFAGVAVAGVVGGIVGAANRGLANGGIGVAAADISNSTPRNLGFYANQALSGAAGAIAGAATRSATSGTSFSDGILAAIPDVIGATIGNAIGDKALGRGAKPAALVLNNPSGQVYPSSVAQDIWGDGGRPQRNVYTGPGFGPRYFMQDRIGNETTSLVMTDYGGATRTGDGDNTITVIGQPFRWNPFDVMSAVVSYTINTVGNGYTDYIRPHFRQAEQFINRFDLVNRGLDAVGAHGAAASVRGLRGGTARFLANSVEGVFGLVGSLSKGAYRTAANLSHDPIGTVSAGLNNIDQAIIADHRSGSVMRFGRGVKSDLKSSINDISSGDPRHIEIGVRNLIQPALGAVTIALPITKAGAFHSVGRGGILAAESATGALTSIGRNRVTFQGLEVRAVRDLSHVDDATLSVMAKDGFAAKLPNGEKLYLHHHQQNPAGFIVEIPSSKHSIGKVNQHPFGNTPGSGLSVQQRADFNVWRENYWRARAQTEIQRRAGQ